MILSFEVRNFRSILDTVLDFKSTEKKHPNGYKEVKYIDFFDTKIDAYRRVIPINAIFGSNASGKTNLLKAFQAFKSCFFDGIKGKYNPNMVNRKFQATKFTIKFANRNDLYSYTLEYNGEEILEEAFCKNGSILLKVLKGELKDIKLKSDNVDLKDLLIQSCFDGKVGITDKKFISPFSAKLRTLLPNLDEDLNILYLNMSKLNIFSTNDFPYSFGIDLLNKFTDSDDGFREIVEQLQKFDIDIEKMQFKPDRLPLNDHSELVLDDIETYHKDIGGNLVRFKIKDESYGTQILFGLIGIILYVLKQGGALIIDELDKSLHFIIINRVIHLFKNKDLNKRNAQLIFTAHSTDIMEDSLMRASEISVVEKHLSTGSIVTKNEMRNIINFRLQYINGNIGGLPNA